MHVQTHREREQENDRKRESRAKEKETVENKVNAVEFGLPIKNPSFKILIREKGHKEGQR